MVIGEENGRIHLYRNNSINTEPIWTYEGMISDSTGNPIDLGSNSYSSPALGDIDKDGDIDMVIGEGNCRIHLYRNTSITTEPTWTYKGVVLDLTGNPIDPGGYYYISPALADIDNDGDADMFIGVNYGFIYFYRNDSDSESTIWEDIGKVSHFEYTFIEVNSNSIPTFEDIDSDGDYDLFIGQEEGTISFYLNDGDVTSDSFIDKGKITDSFDQTIDVGSFSSPALKDIDNDGELDMFIGESGGKVYLYRNNPINAEPVWTSEGTENDSLGNTIDIGSNSVPTFVDIDNDGDLDMFIGESDGMVYLYKNTTIGTEPVWTFEGTIDDSLGNTIDVGSNSAPAFVDIDSDGDYDMFIGEYDGDVNYYKNIGGMTSGIWKIVSSNYRTAEGQYKSAPTFVDIDNDGDHDLLNGDSDGGIHFFPTIGASHIYDTPGTYQATLRVTDDAGFTGTNSMSITVSPLNSPSANANAYPVSGDCPLTVAFNGTGSDPDGSIVLYEWDFNGDGTYDWSNTSTGNTSYTYTNAGTFNATLRVTDNDGKNAVDSVKIQSKFVIITSRTDSFNPINGEIANISTTISPDTTFTLKIVDWDGEVHRTLVNNESRTAGTYTDVWDGKDDSGLQVKDGVYFFIIEYSQDGETLQFDLRESAEFKKEEPERTLPVDPFNPYKDDFVEVTYTLTQSAEVSMFFWQSDITTSTPLVVRTLLVREIRGEGDHKEVWDGIDDKGTVVEPGYEYPVTLWVFNLPDNSIIITGNQPKITSISAEPNYFGPAYNPYSSKPTEHTAINFNLSKQSDVEVRIRNSEGVIINTFTKNDISSGANTIIWDGKDYRGKLVKKGGYTIALTAIDDIGNRSLPRYAAVIVHY